MNALRAFVRSVMHRFAVIFNRLSGGKLTPNMVTIIGLLMHVPIAWLMAMGHYWWAAGLLIIFGLLDTVDGELARLQQRESARGMLLDSVTDRMKEILLYIGGAYAIIHDTGRPYLAVWAVAAVGCSLLTSYVNAAGDSVAAKYGAKKHAVNRAFRGGLMPFEVRMTVFVLGLLSGRIALAVIVIAIGAAYTALMRLAGVFQVVGKRDVQG